MTNKLLPLNHKYSVSSGVFAGIDDEIYMKLDKHGEYKYFRKSAVDTITLKRLNNVDIMSDYSENEDALSKKIFGGIKDIKRNKVIGYYSDLYAGYIKESNFRANATSGGFGTWILCELLKTGEIDGVIHAQAVDPKENAGVLFKYKISRTAENIKKGSKARYYPLELPEVIKEVKDVSGRYAVVGISDFITELRLLCEEENIFKERITYMVGLFNAHQKKTKYAEALAWQHGIKPGNLDSIDFRVKNPNNMAWNYQCSLSGTKDNRPISITDDMSSFSIHHWNMGFFKSRFSDYTDNAFNELADITLGDAWLHEYAEDPKGNNILIVRHPKIARIIRDAIKEDRVKLDRINEEQIISSQGMVPHLIDELPYRLYKGGKRGGFVPIKRSKPSKNIPFLRRRVQDLRLRVVDKNSYAYNKAVEAQNFEVYVAFVRRYTLINDYLYKLIDITSRIKNYQKLLKHKTRIRTRLRKISATISNRRVDGAILTLCDDFNYGNVMQRYALQRFLDDNELEFIQLSFYTNYLQSIREKHLGNSLYSFTQKRIVGTDFDVVGSVGYKNYIVGSDQVWRNHGNENPQDDFMPYWLNFLGKGQSNRVAYAASFGVDDMLEALIDDGLVGKIRPLLRNFNAVSVREETGVKIVNEVADREMGPKVVLDPTLLLRADQYTMLINDSDEKSRKSSRLFCYILDIDTYKIRIVDQIRKHYGSSYTLINPNPKEKLEPVEEWLKCYRDAEFVVTDSFHGVVFSIINQVNFIVLANQTRGLTRVKNLLSLVGISNNRLILPEGVEALDHASLPPIDWATVNKRLDKLRQDSGEWLLNNIKGRNNG